MAQQVSKAQKAVAAASSEGTLRREVVKLSPAAAAAVRKLLQVCCHTNHDTSTTVKMHIIHTAPKWQPCAKHPLPKSPGWTRPSGVRGLSHTTDRRFPCFTPAHTTMLYFCRSLSSCSRSHTQQHRLAGSSSNSPRKPAPSSATWSSTTPPSTTPCLNMALRCSTCRQHWQHCTPAPPAAPATPAQPCRVGPGHLEQGLQQWGWRLRWIGCASTSPQHSCRGASLAAAQCRLQQAARVSGWVVLWGCVPAHPCG